MRDCNIYHFFHFQESPTEEKQEARKLENNDSKVDDADMGCTSDEDEDFDADENDQIDYTDEIDVGCELTSPQIHLN